MAEHEITKHTKKIITVARGHDDIKHKIKDILLEIAIIVFAITLSLIVERWRENSAEKTLEHNFLSNLVTDLKEDQKQLEEDSASYVNMKKAFSYYRAAYSGKQLNPDTASRMIDYMYNVVGFVPSSGRFEALKASGKLDVIEDKDLQVEIVNLYQQIIPSLVASTNLFGDFKAKLADHVDHNLVIKNGKTNIQQLMEMPLTYNFLNRDGYINAIIYKYHITLDSTRKIIRKIEEEEK
ncbi:hypothetical protein DYU05_20180 [Mucilaginibacter terrenus]|uniref:Uncharacterized protein n=1 Tax=Mucilaginibacter terrenus TaxID=2482727 RepID=A0A3E2NJH2_9SPHI|nr:hypothetical protein [Mucilaginibacter terrenus]RFZ81080.1 hypothetical protein DYU05_20180 [Mucilaginibacter terrenus]